MTEIVEDVSFPPDSCPEVSLTSSFNKRVLLISESSPIVLHQMHIYLFHLSGLGDAWPINSERKKKKSIRIIKITVTWFPWLSVILLSKSSVFFHLSYTQGESNNFTSLYPCLYSAHSNTEGKTTEKILSYSVFPINSKRARRTAFSELFIAVMTINVFFLSFLS